MPNLLSMPSSPGLVPLPVVAAAGGSFGAIFDGIAPAPQPTPSPMPVSAPLTEPVANLEMPAAASKGASTVEPLKAAKPGISVATLVRPAIHVSDADTPALDNDPAIDHSLVEQTDATPAPQAITAPVTAIIAAGMQAPGKLPVACERPSKVDVMAGSSKPVLPVCTDKKAAPAPASQVRATDGRSPSPTGRRLVAFPTIEAAPVAADDNVSAPQQRAVAEPVTVNIASASTHRPVAEPVVANVPAAIVAASAAPQIVQQLDLARDLAWIGNLAQEIVAATDDCATLKFRLVPGSLGQLDVQLSRSPQGLQVEMTATTERATQIIAAEQPRLLEELRQSGVKTAGSDVATGQQHSQNSGSQRSQTPQQRTDLPFQSQNASRQSSKNESRASGRFA